MLKKSWQLPNKTCQMTNQQMCQMRKVCKMGWRKWPKQSHMATRGANQYRWVQQTNGGRPSKGLHFSCSVVQLWWNWATTELRSCEPGTKCLRLRFRFEQIVQICIILRNVKALSQESSFINGAAWGQVESVDAFETHSADFHRWNLKTTFTGNVKENFDNNILRKLSQGQLQRADTRVDTFET